MTAREKLLKLLEDVTDDVGGDREGSHMEAEELLLQLLGDAEITAAWEEAVDHWWYA